MLGSFGSSSHEEADDGEDQPPNLYNIHGRQIQIQIQQHQPPPIHMRQILLTCADLVSRPDPAAAGRLITVLSANSSPYGDSTERLVHHFTRAISLRLQGDQGPSANAGAFPAPSQTSASDRALLQSSYLSLNQVTPFLRFSHLTANQAILEAVGSHPAIHILDLDVMHGVQWPPLMQAAAERYPPPSLRITGAGDDPVTLHRTGDRLTRFARSLGLPFHFHPLPLPAGDPSLAIAAASRRLPDEALAVNCPHCLHRHLTDRDRLRRLLHAIHSLNPTVVALAEREADHSHPALPQRLAEAITHYEALFESLEATLPPGSGERMAVERVCFGQEIASLVAGRERHERFRSWEGLMTGSGFVNVPLSGFALSQAKLLLRLHYPSPGYQLRISNGSFFLGWQNQPLFSVSAWH